jgi:hypothetical protein
MAAPKSKQPATNLPKITGKPVKQDPVIKTEVTLQQLAYKVVHDNELVKKSLFKDIWKALRKEVSDDVIPMIKEGFTDQSFHTLLRYIYFYISKT